jgi:hypothetical protein
MTKYINFDFATHDDCLEKMLPSDLRALVAERDHLRALVDKHGICTECGGMYSHHIHEPFASCGCGTSEWSEVEMTPYMVLEQHIASLV